MNDDLAIYIGNKIRYYRNFKKMTQQELADKVGIGKAAISNYESGYRTPQQNRMFELSEALGVSINDLFPPTKEEKGILDKIIDISSQLESKRQEKVREYAEQELNEQNKVAYLDDYRDDTLFGAVSAGTGEFLAEETRDSIRIHKSIIPEQHYDMILKVNGDSMEPMFQNEEYIFVRKTKEIRSGQIGIFIIDGESYLKKAYIDDDHLRLVSLNSTYDDLIFNDLNDIDLIGTVVM